MESIPPGFCTVVAVLGIISAAAGIAGEATMNMGFSFYISIILAVLAIITRIYISGCRCCRNDPKSTPMSKYFSVFSWVATVVVVILMLSAILFLIWDGIFALAGVLSLLSAVLGIASYVTAASQATETATNSAVGGNVDPKVNPMSFPSQQSYPPQQFPPQYYHPPQYPPRQYPPQ